MPPEVAGAPGGLGSPHLARIRTAEAVTEHCRAAIVAAGRPASRSSRSWRASSGSAHRGGGLEQVAAIARDHGLLVLADGKRDVPVTARAYAQALVGETETPFGAIEGLGADAFTANPLLGRDAVEPLADAKPPSAAPAASCWCVRRILVRRSSRTPATRRCTSARPARGRARRGSAGSGLSCVGAVTGATRPDHLARLRELMPRAIFLLPGVGAQGGRVEDLGRFRAPPGGGARGRLALDRGRAPRAVTRRGG